MALFSLREIFDILAMTLFVGYIFSGYFRQPSKDPLAALQQRSLLGALPSDIVFAALATAPGIVLHELGHKFAALAFGIHAQFSAAYFWLALGVILRMMNFGFIFFVPAYVSMTGNVQPLPSALIAAAGPAVNAVLWGLAWLSLRQHWLRRRYDPLLFLTARINMFLFIFNMLPFFFFDGYKVFSGLYHAFF